jgi:hypothetical protein
MQLDLDFGRDEQLNKLEMSLPRTADDPRLAGSARPGRCTDLAVRQLRLADRRE